MGVDTATLDEIQKDIRVLRLALDAIRAKVDQLRSKQLESAAEGRQVRLTDLKGIWGGIGLSYGEIKAAKYKMPEDTLIQAEDW